MKTRLTCFAAFLLCLAGLALPLRSALGLGSFWELGAILLPAIVIFGPAMLLPRKAALGWCLLVMVGAAILMAMSLSAESSCSGDGCIGYAIFTYFIGGPILGGTGAIAAIRYFAKGPMTAIEPAA
jgi:hypothetical protein